MRPVVRARVPLPGRLAAAGLVLLGLGACSSRGGASPPAQAPAAAARGRGAAAGASSFEPALRLLSEGSWSAAGSELNRLLASDPENPQLHLLNGLSYYQRFLAGDRGAADLAETGFLLALQLDPTLPHASRSLGILYLRLRRYDEARTRLLEAFQGRPDDGEAALALATSSYYARDLPLASWAVGRALALGPDDRGAVRAAALIRAASGDSAGARAELSHLGEIGEPEELRYVRRRVEEWGTVHADLRTEGGRGAGSGSPGEAPVLLAQWGVGQPQAIPSPQPGQGTAPAASGPRSRSWSDCPTGLAGAGGSGISGGFASSGSFGGSPVYAGGGTTTFSATDELTPLPALPSPCEGLPLPRMAVVDVVILRTQSTEGRSNGVNLLEGLKATLTGTWSYTRTTDASGTTVARALGGGATLGAGAAAGITYSLNIFNVENTRAEVIARPSLLALDRISSSFFSGSTVSVAMSGQYGGNIQEKNVGVALSVTPTFVDDESMLLAVRAARTFVEPVTVGTFNESMTTSKNTVTGNVLLRFGETMILSGLREQELMDDRNGVPGLRDAPLLQYFFGRRVESKFSKHILIMVTPRKPPRFEEAIRSGERLREEVERLRKRGHLSAADLAEVEKASAAHESNLAAIVATLGPDSYYREFKTGDLTVRGLETSSSLQRILKDVARAIYY